MTVKTVENKEASKESKLELIKLTIEVAELYEVDWKGKSFFEIHEEITQKLDREALEFCLETHGHIEGGLVGKLNEILRDRLMELDKKIAASAGTPAATNSILAN